MITPVHRSKRFNYPNPGLGLGLRTVHYPYILQHQPEVDWFEIISENFIDIEGWTAYMLDWVAERYPIAMHGVSLSIGSSDPLNTAYLYKLKQLAKRTGALWISDHLCWTGSLGYNSHDLLPMPLTEESFKHVVSRVKQVQDILERPIVLENPSSYLTFVEDTLTEWDFMHQMAEEADCGLLLDVNNVYVSSVNHGFDANEYIEKLPHHRVVQMHIAGHTHCGTHIIDTHDKEVTQAVWKLYRKGRALCPDVATLLEWDAHIPEFPVLQAELQKAKQTESVYSIASQDYGDVQHHPVVMDMVPEEKLSIVSNG